MAEPNLLNVCNSMCKANGPKNGVPDHQQEQLTFTNSKSDHTDFSSSAGAPGNANDSSFHDAPLYSGLYSPGRPEEFRELDLQLVHMNEEFCGRKESHELHLDEVGESNRVMKRLSTMFSPSQDSMDKKAVLCGPENIRLGAENHDKNIDMASAIYSENAVTKEDNLSYHGYTIRTEGADLCGSKHELNNAVTNSPKIILDEDKWTMLYGSYDDDGLGVVEIEVPPGISVRDIQCEGPSQGLITIDVPQNRKYVTY
ncbi:unnamed protein product [Allacma fusca]|uniref:Uncharacterized protein n=1 Tax=Allacma fusca TaxID=39272 RepID=A0A8J2NU73_9HEXA|nr:unnamed protein product [Allacma fusca]